MKQKDINKLDLRKIDKKIRRYQKPYLLRHAGSLVMAAVLLIYGGINLGSQLFVPRNFSVVLSRNTGQEPEAASTLIKTSKNLSFLADKSYFELKAFGRDNNGEYEVDINMIEQDEQLSRISVAPVGGAWSPIERASQLDIVFGTSYPEDLADSDSQITTETLSTSFERLGDITFQKILKKNTIILGSQSIANHTVSWLGNLNNAPVKVELRGLSGNKLPEQYQNLLGSFNSTKQVLGAQSGIKFFETVSAEAKISERYLVDSVSPAVVKIYNIVCGALLIDGQVVSADTCEVSTGSGFFVSSKGHIATNGHVVTYDAEDALVNALLSNPGNIPGFLRYMGLSDAQINAGTKRPELLAAIIAKVYDAPPDSIRFKNPRTALIVSLGSMPLVLGSEEDMRKAIDGEDSEQLKKAEIIGVDYFAKDLLVIESDSETGFSSSDVAIVKIDSHDTPFIRLYDEQVTQNQNITIIGFPGDAENQLTDNNSISPTVTNGTISAIRFAAGSNHRLYQSDADASRGSSGGPVISEDGKALGILTYRFKSSLSVDAAKSYIRDIADIRALANKHEIPLGAVDGQTQTKWEEGLGFYSRNRFSKALTVFKDVKNSYPPHRLAVQYEVASEDAITNGRDIKDLPMAAVLGLSITGAAAGAWVVILISRHHKAHKSYKRSKAARVFTPHSHHNGSGYYAPS